MSSSDKARSSEVIKTVKAQDIQTVKFGYINLPGLWTGHIHALFTNKIVLIMQFGTKRGVT